MQCNSCWIFEWKQDIKMSFNPSYAEVIPLYYLSLYKEEVVPGAVTPSSKYSHQQWNEFEISNRGTSW